MIHSVFDYDVLMGITSESVIVCCDVVGFGREDQRTASDKSASRAP